MAINRILPVFTVFLTAISLILITNLFYPTLAFSSDSKSNNNSDISVEATGVSVITKGDKVLARDGAINDALRRAVESGIGTLVSSETMVENFEVLSDKIYTQSSGYVSNYDIINEETKGSLYKVTIKAKVKSGVIEDDLASLGLLIRKAQNPRVLFMIAEKNIGEKLFTSWWMGADVLVESIDMNVAETAMKEAFIEQGFEVVDISSAGDTVELTKPYKLESSMDLSDDDAISIAKELDAEIIIKGKAIADGADRVEGARVGSYFADITVTAIRTDDSKVIASGSGHGVSRHISKITGGNSALKKAGQDASKELIENIIAKWSKGTNTIKITIRGVGSYKTAKSIKNSIKNNIRGVTGVFERKFKDGVLVIEVESAISTAKLADKITSLKAGKKLRVIGTTKNTINFKVK